MRPEGAGFLMTPPQQLPDSTHVTQTGTATGPDADSRHAEQTLERYRLLSQHARDIVLFIRPDNGRIIEGNDAAIHAYGWTREELLAMKVFDLRAPGTTELIPEQMFQADSSGITFETSHRRKDGSVFPVEVSSRGAEITGQRLLLSIIRDTTDRRRAEEERRESEARYRDLFENANDIIYTLDMQRRITSVNRRAEQTFGYTREECLGRSVAELIPPEYHARMEDALRRKLMGEESPTTYEVEVICKDGHRIPLEVSSRLLVRDDRPVGIQGIARDITERRRTEEALRRSETRFRKLFEQSPLSIQILDPDGRTLAVNRAWKSLWGSTMEEHLVDYNLLHDEQLVALGVMPFIRKAFAGEPVEIPPVGYAPDRGAYRGQQRWVRAFLYPVKGAAGQVEEVILLHEDITARRQASEALRESEERLRLALDAGQCGVWDWDIRADRVTCSDRIYEFHGLPPGTFGGRVQDFASLIHPDDAERIADAIRRAMESREPYGEEFRIVRPSGEVRWIATHGRVLRDEADRPVRMLGATIDVTERRAAEEALREADRRKDDFLAMLAHELRNPLGPIRTATEVLKLIGPAEPILTQARDMIQRQVAHMARLVDDLLDVSRISRGKILLRRERFDLAPLVRSAVEDHRPMLEGTGLTLSAELANGPLWVEGDPTRLSQVIGNLLHNANKFTDAGGNVHVRLDADAPCSEAVIQVRDTGIGMEPDILRRLFEPFSQAESSLDRTRGGLGLGLALVHGLIELHGGRISAASGGAGQGSEFIIRLPLCGQSSLNQASPSPRPARARSLRVLIIEDNRDAAESLRILLRLAGHSVEVACTGRAGVDRARQWSPDVVLCDIGLPGGMDGFAVARALRADPEQATATLIALSGYGQEEDQRQARQAGFDRHLTKPVDPTALVELLNSFPDRH
jgi:PAS domain S-box-containing protein